MAENPGEKARKYLTSIRTVLSEIEISKTYYNIDEKSVRSIVESAESYVEDARHYLKAVSYTHLTLPTNREV